MTKRFAIRKLFLLMSAAGLICNSSPILASGFQLWELDAVSIGDYHAGHAAIADDASTSFNNPAGLIRIKNQQVILGAATVLTNFGFKGSVDVDTLGTGPQSVTAQGGGFNLVPFGHYAAPITDTVVFGFSVLVPFGLKTDYGRQSIVRYSAMLSSLQVIDYAPALGIALTNRFSIGFGLDVQRMKGQFNQTATAIGEDFDTLSENSGSDTAYGYHLGALYQFSPATRVGLSYHSQVVHHMTGTSTFTGPLANDAVGGAQSSPNLKANITLPPVTSLSGFHAVNSTWDIMGSISYVQWDVVKNIVLQNTSGILNSASTNTLPITINENYRNSWNYTVGTNYHLNEQWIFRGGIGYDQTPSNDVDRNLQLPDSNRVILALGGHYQASKAIGLDFGWTHVFSGNTRINNVTQTVGDETVITNGSVVGNADVYALQLVWDIA